MNKGLSAMDMARAMRHVGMTPDEALKGLERSQKAARRRELQVPGSRAEERGASLRRGGATWMDGNGRPHRTRKAALAAGGTPVRL